jgi:RNA polymerase sigma-70 factor, ECF subfamily
MEARAGISIPPDGDYVRATLPAFLTLGVREAVMPAANRDLVDAMSRVATGDRAAFAALYSATSAKLFGVVVRILKRRDLAEEVLQDVYLQVWQRAVDYDPTIASPITWLVTIARNKALDQSRRGTMTSLDEFPELLEVASDDDPLADQERQQERQRLQACLDRLEPERSEIVRLAYTYAMTREEIAARINRPVSTVKTWLRRSLAHLKDCLGP